MTLNALVGAPTRTSTFPSARPDDGVLLSEPYSATAPWGACTEVNSSSPLLLRPRVTWAYVNEGAFETPPRIAVGDTCDMRVEYVADVTAMGRTDHCDEQCRVVLTCGETLLTNAHEIYPFTDTEPLPWISSVGSSFDPELGLDARRATMSARRGYQTVEFVFERKALSPVR